MSEREQDQNEERDETQENDDWVREVEEDPSTAGSPEEPGDELRGG